jgi:two-component system, NarL family, response regulator NreC
VSDKIYVFIADDHAVLRAGLRMLLGAEIDMEVVGEAADGIETLARVQECNPEVILLDISMPNLNGLEIIHQIQEHLPNCRILILTMHDDEAYLREALTAGVAGYVLKQAADTELLSAIRVVHKGGTYLHRTHRQILLERQKPVEIYNPPDDSIDKLSPREHEVLVMLAGGHTNKQIADRLFLSIKTIETYKARLLGKLGLHTRTELVRYALQQGLMKPGEKD